ncbi:LamB/YcsF family protein [Natribacillus halophilus]|uniref:5-oxoprolinase subunit A n=1 Tax=Natribacillus halophilus TaxID=549003 RepID=A0A1G8MV77_9BACI|nr:5-oxoprolinase subunit PxpA [Natribacillus halophilus]SDI71715.1 UPF0271 protein [Natribacillus halophilus]
MKTIDLNCDMGESFGVYKLGSDEEILPYISSANIACGFHAGDPATMRKTVRLAIENDVAIGAHPGLPDLMGFGRRHMDLLPEEAYDLIAYQIGALWGVVQSEGGQMRHVKAHGMLYNRATVDPELSDALARAVYDIDPNLVLFGLPGGEVLKAGTNVGLQTASEVFADRTYQEDGTLTSRREANALIDDTNQAGAQVVRMIEDGKVRSLQGTDVDILAETICIHGDGPHAFEFAKNVREKIEHAGIKVQSFA